MFTGIRVFMPVRFYFALRRGLRAEASQGYYLQEVFTCVPTVLKYEHN